jgi:hypothetical protein
LLVFLIIFGILVGENVVEGSASAVLLTLVLLSNTGGLFALTMLMGYGLIAFPVMLWQRGDLNRQLGLAQQKAASRFKDLGEVSHDMGLAVADVMKTNQEVDSAPHPHPPISRDNSTHLPIGEIPIH